MAYSWNGTMASMVSYATPAQFGQQTNWSRVGPGFGIWAWTDRGDAWQPRPSSTSGLTPTVASTQFIASNAPPGRLAAAFCGVQKLYQLSDDGTLWEKPFASLPWATPPNAPWRRFGKRSDWTGVWGENGTAVGLTADGTIWEWGIDTSGAPRRDFLAQIEALQGTILEMFGIRPAAGAKAGMRAWKPLYRKTPRPVMRVVKQD